MPEAIKPALGAFVLTFLFTIHATPATYINSTFLAQFFGDQQIGWLYGLGAAAGLVSLWVGNRAARRWGNYRVVRTALQLNLVAVLGLAWAPNALVAGLSFALGFFSGVAINFLIDIFVEAASRDQDTGKTRGWYLTAGNLAFIAGPAIASLILSDHQFYRVYLWGALFLTLALIFLRRRFADFEDPRYAEGGFRRGLLRLWQSSDLRRVFSSLFVLQTFYIWMIIYVPLYLTQRMGFEVHEVTLVMSVALLPFLILQEWLGKLADCCTGEKEFLTGGLAVMGLSTLALALIDSRSFAVWAAALFVTRIGAAMTESMIYSYIFRQIGAAETDTMQAFHSVRPVATLVAPVIALPIFALGGGIPSIFAVLAGICLLSIAYVWPMRDSR